MGFQYPTERANWVNADGTSFRDVQSARAFAGGFFGRRSCSAARAAAIVEATAAAQPLLLPLVSDDVEAGCAGPSEADVLRSFGGDVGMHSTCQHFQPRRSAPPLSTYFVVAE